MTVERDPRLDDVKFYAIVILGPFDTKDQSEDARQQLADYIYTNSISGKVFDQGEIHNDPMRCGGILENLSHALKKGVQ